MPSQVTISEPPSPSWNHLPLARTMVKNQAIATNGPQELWMNQAVCFLHETLGVTGPTPAPHTHFHTHPPPAHPSHPTLPPSPAPPPPPSSSILPPPPSLLLPPSSPSSLPSPPSSHPCGQPPPSMPCGQPHGAWLGSLKPQPALTPTAKSSQRPINILIPVAS